MSISEQSIIILCRPDESRNIGSVCRAMKNMNMTRLRIVGNKEDYDEERISILAVHAFDIYEHAVFFKTLKEALADCVWTAGTTRRRGKNRKDWLLLPEEFIQHCSKIPEGNIAVVFGNERTGLTDDELSLCNSGVIIPSNADEGSLNLSHAVQIICYTIFRAQTQISPGYVPITQNRLDSAVNTISTSLQNMGFFKIAGKPDMEMFWKNILSRAALSEGEAVYIEKMFTKASGLFKKQNSGHETETN